MASTTTDEHNSRIEGQGPPSRRPRAFSRDVPADGQSVIVTARWVLVLSGLILALWNPGAIGEIRLQVLALLLLAVGNFYLHAQLLMRRPAIDLIAYAASAADIAVITLLVLSQGGFASPLFIFYFPALLAFSVAFPASWTVCFASAVVGAYACVSLFSAASADDVRGVILRIMMLAAVALAGAMYRRIEERRRGAVVDMLRSAAQEAAEDVFFGQAVIIWARWFVILTGAMLTLWTATTIQEITINTLLIVTLMGMNFFLHGRYLMERPANRTLLLAVGLIDLLVISGMILTWPGQAGARSDFFVFYYPIVLAFAFVLTPRWTVGYTGLALVAYGAVCLFAVAGSDISTIDPKLLVMRLITLAAMGGLGAYYWRIQRRRRREARGHASAIDELQARLGQPVPAE